MDAARALLKTSDDLIGRPHESDRFGLRSLQQQTRHVYPQAASRSRTQAPRRSS